MDAGRRDRPARRGPSDPQPRTHPGDAMTPPSIRLAFGAIFWRIFLVALVLSEIQVWRTIRRIFPGPWKPQRIPALLYVTPMLAFKAFAFAAAATVVLDQLARLVARAVAGRWYFPTGTGSEQTPVGFHLDARDRLLAEVPARRRAGRGWRPGTLVLTSRSLWFFPVAWELEPWSRPLDGLASIRRVPYRPLLGSFVRGVPDRLAVRDADGTEAEFAVADPSAVRDWFARPEVAQYRDLPGVEAGPEPAAAASPEREPSLREPHDV